MTRSAPQPRTSHRTSRRRTSRRRTGVIVVVLALLSVLLAVPTAQGKPRTPPADQRAAAAADKPADLTGTQPRVAHDQVVGDFLGKGYEQRAVVEDGNLNIYDQPSQGGRRLKSTPTDLEVPRKGSVNLWSRLVNGVATDNRLASVYLAWTPDGFYLAGATKSGQAVGTYGNVVYRVKPDGSCATADCADWIKNDFDDYVIFPGETEVVYTFVTAMAAGSIGTKPVLAIGMSGAGNVASGPSNTANQLGVIIIDAADGTTLGRFNDYATHPGISITPPYVTTSLAFDPGGSGLLAFGALSPFKTGFAVLVRADGTFGRFTTWTAPDTGGDFLPSVLSTAIGRRADGVTPVVAFGLTDGSVKLWDPGANSPNTVASFTPPATDPAAPVDAVTFVNRIVGTSGAQDVVAVSSKGDLARVLRYDGATALAPQAVASGGVTTTSAGGIMKWFPGHKAGRITFTNSAQEPVIISFANRRTEAYGCWFAPAFGPKDGQPDSSAFPASGSLRLENGQSTDRYTVGGLTAAPSGNCAADKTDSVSQWATYLVVTPVRRPADAITVKVVLNRDGTLAPAVVGGGLRITYPHYPVHWMLGDTRFYVIGPGEPQAAGPMNLKGSQLDAGGADTEPVYRFDLPAATWKAPTSTPRRISMVKDPLEVWGFDVDNNVKRIGLLAPQGVPTRSGSSGAVTLAPVSFYWQNPPVGEGTRYQAFSIRTSNYVSSNWVYLSTLAPPSGGAQVTGLIVCPVNDSDSCDGDATPFANGLDQAALRIQIKGPTGSVLATDDANYGRVYYRDVNGALVTGIIPEDPTITYTRISPYPGAYANDNVAPTTPRTPPTRVGGRFGYVSTTSPDAQTIRAYVGGYLLPGGDITVDGSPLTTQLYAAGRALSVSNGFYLTGCRQDNDAGECVIANPKTTTTSTSTSFTPALYYTNDPDTGRLKIGLQFSTMAQTAFGSLPLQQLANQGDHSVAQATLSVSGGEVTFAEAATNFQPADNIDTYVVTHGQQVPVRNVNVGQSN